jgi:hypothetical protein
VAIVARMVAQEVTARNAAVWVPTTEDDPDAVRPADAFNNYHYGIPFWLRGFEFIRPEQGKGQESYKLTVVRSGGPDDPNNDFFLASPSGEMTMTIDNPGAMGYVKAGEFYRVTVEKIRGPRESS